MSTPPASDPSQLPVDLSNVQGNSLAGFLKDFQRFVFLRIDDPAAARGWLAGISTQAATASDVSRFNTLFSELRARLGYEAIKATWMNIAFTHGGLTKLVDDPDLAGFSPAFMADIAQHAPAALNDPRADQWVPPFNQPQTIDVLLVVASDDEEDGERGGRPAAIEMGDGRLD